MRHHLQSVEDGPGAETEEQRNAGEDGDALEHPIRNSLRDALRRGLAIEFPSREPSRVFCLTRLTVQQLPPLPSVNRRAKVMMYIMHTFNTTLLA